MPRSNPLQPSFNAGELSPRLAARTDFAKYPAGVETAVNVVPLPEGGLMRRPATRYVADEKSSSVKGRLKRFEFSTTQAYMLELGEKIMRFYRHQGQIVSGVIDGSITNGAFTDNINDWDDRSTGGAGNQISHDSTNGRLTLETSGTASNDIGWAEQDVTVGASVDTNDHILKFRVLGAPGDQIELRIGTTTTGSEIVADLLFSVGFHCRRFIPGDGNGTIYIQFRNRGNARDKDMQIDDVSLIASTSGTLGPVEIDTPWTEAQIFTVNGPQSADTLYLYHPDHPTYKLLRLGHTSWSLVEVPWVDGPYIAENTSATTLTATAATGLGITVTASAVTGINGNQGFLSTDVGRSIRITDSVTNWGWGVITTVSSTTVVLVDIRRTFVVTTAETAWRLGAWSSTTGYPSVGAFYEQRQFMANTADQPQTLWGTQTADFENQAPDSPNSDGTTWAGTVEDDDALNFTLSSDTVEAIRWLSPGEDTLVMGTTGGEWIPESDGIVITPSDIVIRRRTTHGSANIQPVRVGNVVLFVQKAKRKIREFGIADTIAAEFRAFDMTRLAQHVTVGGIDEMAYQQEPDSLVWCVRSDGQLLSMTFRREEDVVGWARHIIGGSFSTGDAVVESVAVIPGANGAGQTQSSEDRDEVWITVKRTINGSTVRYVEVLERDFEDGDDEDDSYYADSVITFDGTATTSITGLTHLANEKVKILADGFIHPDRTVSATGTLTLDAAASVVQIGLGYGHIIKPLKVEGGTAVGTAIGKLKQYFGWTFVLLNCHTLTFGPDASNLRTIDFRVVSDPMDTAVPFFTGERFEEFDDGWKTDPRIVIQSSDPTPFTLLALAPEIDIRELK